MKLNIRLVYLYLVSLISLFIVAFGLIRLTDLMIKTVAFPNADNYFYETVVPMATDGSKTATAEAKQQQEENFKMQKQNSERQKQRDIASTASMIIVGLPLYLYHWKLIQKDRLKE